MSDVTQNLHKYLMAPAMSGMVGTMVFMGIYGTGGALKMGPISMNPAYVFGSSIAIGDALGTLATDAISESNQVAQLDVAQRMLIKPAITGVMALGVLSALVAPPRDMMAAGKVIALGAAGNIGGGYLNELVMSTVA